MTWPRLAALSAASALAVGAAPALAKDSPFVGTWKLNPGKSQFTGDTMTFKAQRGGKIRFNAGGQYYLFKIDGKPREGLMRQRVAWTKVEDRTWRAVWSLKKKPVVTETFVVAPDGGSLTDTMAGKRADGTPFEDSVAYERTAGDGDTLIGTWRSTKANVTGFQTITIAPHEPDGIVFTMVDFQSTCNAHLDGEDYALKGPTTPPAVTLSFRRMGKRTLQIVQKQGGMPLYQGAISVDDDGKTLTWDWRPVSVNEPMKAVFDRQ